MKYILLTFKNIKKFICYHPILFSFLFIVQIVCCIAVFISCGMVYNMNYIEEERLEDQTFGFCLEDDEDLYSEVTIREDEKIVEEYYQTYDPITREEIKKQTIEHPKCISMKEARPLIEEFFQRIEKFKPTGGEIRFYQNRQTTIGVNSKQFFSIYPEFPAGDDFETPYIVDSDEHIFVAPVIHNGKHSEMCPYDIGETYTIGGEEFRCAGNNTSFYYMPYKTVPDTCVIDCIYAYFDNNLYEEDIEEIAAIAQELFNYNPNQSARPDPIEPFKLQLSQMLFVISIVVMVIVVLTIAKFYHFVLDKRKDTLSVLRLCGCTRKKVHFIYMLEIFITMALSTAAGFAVFRLVLFDYIAGMYHSFDKFFSVPVVCVILEVYFLISIFILAVTVIPSTKASITEMSKT